MNKNDFEYKYTAPTSEERQEIESIKNSYIQKESTKNGLDYLRRLDSRVKNISIMVSIMVGVLGTLIFGLGFSMILEWQILLWGIIVSIVGFVILICAYPINMKILKYLKNKYAEEIINLSNELLKND